MTGEGPPDGAGLLNPPERPWERSGPPRWIVPGALAVVLLLALAWLAGPQSPPRRLPAEDRIPSVPADRWLFGLQGLEGIHFQEYRGLGLAWELWSPGATVQAQRYVFGYLPSRPLLVLQQPRARILSPGLAIEVHARRTTYDSRQDLWVFVDGQLRQHGPPRRFKELHWRPASRRLEEPGDLRLPPILRFWRPLY
jgi:hypothetical protein